METGILELSAFVAKLTQDGPAVQAALKLPYSQGQTEGQINRLKTLKRTMYGRANFDLLRKRFPALICSGASSPCQSHGSGGTPPCDRQCCGEASRSSVANWG
jgi:hypothetical protein